MDKTTQELIENLKTMNEVNGNFTKREVDTFVFCFLLISYLEKAIQKTLYEALLDSQKEELKYSELIDLLLKEKTFTQKLDIFEFLINGSSVWVKDKNFVSLCRRVNSGIRNKLFHFKLNELEYRGMDVSKVENQNKIIADLISAEAKIKQGEEPISMQGKES
ncbi:hypothetical protein KJ885_05090 [Patescibacteria group bacterium]|nr:hypothetical protein [Patescibacteria group bacterium]